MDGAVDSPDLFFEAAAPAPSYTREAYGKLYICVCVCVCVCVCAFMCVYSLVNLRILFLRLLLPPPPTQERLMVGYINVYVYMCVCVHIIDG